MDGDLKLECRYFGDDSWLIEDGLGTVWVRIFIEEEGKDGVYLGFDSGSRDNFTAPLPVEDEENGYGDSDAYLFRTVGKPCNQKIEVSEVK